MINYDRIRKIISYCREQHMYISATESCTGGLVSASIVHEPGSSDVFCEGYVTYSNEAKMRILNVNEQTLAQYGAVSEQTASEMAAGLHAVSGADICISTTGIAGPGGGTEEKEVGLVYIGLWINGSVIVKENHFLGDRTSVREQTVNEAFHMIESKIKL